MEIPSPLNDAIETLCVNLLEAEHIDWYNNDGGSGTMKLTVNDNMYCEMEAYNNYTEQADVSFDVEICDLDDVAVAAAGGS